jgi:hypothetical protein
MPVKDDDEVSSGGESSEEKCIYCDDKFSISKGWEECGFCRFMALAQGSKMRDS